MAQGTVVPSMPQHGAWPHSRDDFVEIEQCEKLVRFRDEVLSGSHPHIKPPQVPAKQASTVSHSSQPAESSASGDFRHMTGNAQAFQGNLQRSAPSVDSHALGLGAMAKGMNGAKAARAFGSKKAEINPVLLEKSDDLIKAEIQLQRQRLERTLREQLEQRRASTKTSQQASDSLNDVDVAGVLSKALAPVQPPIAQTTDTVAANASASSDSFDDNTFYSSQHGTPESNQISKIPHEVEDEEMRDGSPYEPELDLPPSQPTELRREVPGLPPSYQTSQVTTSQLEAGFGSDQMRSLARIQQFGAVRQTPGQVNNSAGGSQARTLSETPNIQSGGEASRSAESGSTDKEVGGATRDEYRIRDQLLNPALRRRESPVVRAHNLSPIAPQPAHVSSLAITRQPAFDQEVSSQMATSAQITSLRNEHSATSTPDSLPQGNKTSERKKSKKKKRKSDRVGPTGNTVASPHVKTEPRSPSPLSAPSYARPNKRQRQGHLHSQPGLEYSGLRRNEPIILDDSHDDDLYQPSSVKASGEHAEYQRHESRRYPLEAATARYGREYLDDGRSVVIPSHLQPTSPNSYPAVDGQGRAVRTVSHSYVDRPYVEYRDSRDASIMSMRPGTARGRSRSPTVHDRQGSAMPPPRAPPRRILMDDFGREYLEPLRSATVLRETLAPGGHPADPYDRAAPVRALVRRPETYEEEDVIYQGSSPHYSDSRRIITQADMPPPEYRTYREREYTTQVMGPPGEDYMHARRVESREVGDIPREYITRSASVRPPTERYDAVGSYERRQIEERPPRYVSVRPASVRPFEPTRFEAPPSYERQVGELLEDGPMRAASVRPLEAVRYADIPMAPDYRTGNVRPEVQSRSLPVGMHSEVRREAMPRPPELHVYSARPGEGHLQVIPRGYDLRQEEHYRPPRNDDEVIYIDRLQHDSYR